MNNRANNPTSNSSTTEYSHAMADAYPYPISVLPENIEVLISPMIGFVSLFDINTIVYTRFNRIIGLIVGSVIFQKHSHPEPPSIFAASYIAGSIFCRLDRKIRICTPEYHRIVIMLSKRPEIGFASIEGRNPLIAVVIAWVSSAVILPAHFTGGSTHLAVLRQDCASVDIRCMRLRKELQPLYSEITGLPYREKHLRVKEGREQKEVRIADVSGLTCDEAGYRRLSMALGEAVRRKGYLVVWDPGITIHL